MKLRSMAAALGAMLLLAAFPAYAAAGISKVSLDIGPEGAETLGEGQIYSGQEPLEYEGSYYIYDYSHSSSYRTPKSAYTYSIDVRPENGYEFSPNCTVEVRGAYRLDIEVRTADRLRVKAWTYPYYTLKNVTGIEQNGDVYSWKKVDYASAYDVVIYYYEDGEDKTAKRSVTNRKVDVSSYNSGDRSVDHIVVRARRGSDQAAGYLANGMYVDENGAVDTEQSDEEYKFSVTTARSDALATTSQQSTVGNALSKDRTTAGPGVKTSPEGSGGWVEENGGWYYILNGQRLTGWINPQGNDWYLLGADGLMRSGWQLVDGQWYLLNTLHDGAFGRMLTGWWKVNGQWYYLNQSSGGGRPYGAMYANEITPDGYRVNAQGARIE